MYVDRHSTRYTFVYAIVRKQKNKPEGEQKTMPPGLSLAEYPAIGRGPMDDSEEVVVEERGTWRSMVCRNVRLVRQAPPHTQSTSHTSHSSKKGGGSTAHHSVRCTLYSVRSSVYIPTQ